MIDKLKISGLVKLSDKQTCQNDGNGLIPYKILSVLSIKTFVEQNGHCTYKLVELSEDNLWLIIKVAQDGEWYAILGFQPPDFPTLFNRQEVIDNNCQWIFKEPDDLDNYSLEDLEFADELTVEDSNVVFKALNPTLFGEWVDGENLFALNQLRADKPIENPELVVLEFGDLENNSTVIGLFQGVILQDNELEIF